MLHVVSLVEFLVHCDQFSSYIVFRSSFLADYRKGLKNLPKGDCLVIYSFETISVAEFGFGESSSSEALLSYCQRWLVVLFYGVSTSVGSFNAELDFKQFSLV